MMNRAEAMAMAGDVKVTNFKKGEVYPVTFTSIDDTINGTMVSVVINEQQVPAFRVTFTLSTGGSFHKDLAFVDCVSKAGKVFNAFQLFAASVAEQLELSGEATAVDVIFDAIETQATIMMYCKDGRYLDVDCAYARRNEVGVAVDSSNEESLLDQ